MNPQENSKKSPEELKKLKEESELNLKKNFVKHFIVLNKQKTEKLDMINIFLKNDAIRTFLQQEGEKIKEEKSSQQETESSPPTNVSPANSSGKSIGSSAGTDSQSPLPLYLFLAMIF